MPVFFHEGGFRFHFYAREGVPLEPMHIHAARPGGDAKLCCIPRSGWHIIGGSVLASCAGWSGSSLGIDRKSRMHGTPFSPEATSVEFDEDSLWVALEDGRTIGVPLAWYPRLLNGSHDERRDYCISPSGLRWGELDEDISIASLLADRLEGPAPARAA